MCWPSGKEARIPARVFRASAPQASDAVIADFMSHLLPENNWSELNILNSVSKAFIKTRGYGLEFRVRPGLEFRLPAANINYLPSFERKGKCCLFGRIVGRISRGMC